MSKEYLEAFNKLMEESPEVHIKSYELVKQALQRLDFIDNTKPSETLEYLKELEMKIELEENECFCTEYDLIKVDIIRDYILKAQEQEKVLKILKEHKINIYRLLDVESVSQYNEWENDNLTEEEFELLKRWVCKNE